MTASAAPPLVLWEDNDLLAINKPSGINTHRPDRFAQDGIHEWLQKQSPQWRQLSILHRLDKETSGVMLFGKTRLANKSLTDQFERGSIRKTYVFLSRTPLPMGTGTIATPIDGKPARTTFRSVERIGNAFLIEAIPTTGRTHQVRIHAAAAGVPILGDEEHGVFDTTIPRMMLHASKLEFAHPKSGDKVGLSAPPPKSFLDRDALTCARELRDHLFEDQGTSAYRLIAGKADGFPDFLVDAFGEVALVQRLGALKSLPHSFSLLEARFQLFLQDLIQGKRAKPEALSPAKVLSPQPFLARENGLHFVVRMDHGFSPGLFLDQRENRRWLREICNGKEMLNCFAYTCSFSVVAAAAGARTTSVDLSKSYLDWGRENFRVNGLNAGPHDFIFGDLLNWLERFAKRGRRWDIVLLDPPTFGTTRKGRVFRAAKDYVELIRLAVRLVRPGGVLFCSTNQRSVTPGQFLNSIQRALVAEHREILQTRYETQPLDFRVADGERPYLKTFWTTVG